MTLSTRANPNAGDMPYLANLMRQAAKFDDMVHCVRKYAEANPALGNEERDLLVAAYEKVCSPLRHSWRILSNAEQQEEQKGNDRQAALCKDARVKIEEELGTVCRSALELVDGVLLPAVTNDEAEVFFLRLRGDLFRYVAEVTAGDSARSAGLASYSKAWELARLLPASHPTRLSLALNFSVFYFEILKSPDRACAHAKGAFDEAVSELDQQPDHAGGAAAKTVAAIMELIRSNLASWTETGDDARAGDDGVGAAE
eukprot:TRINITY_DN92955_c0_g1_i1.p1 TRINITY_DN92955_c0_g1~~TRINITY_DN92955_c0_g1_i1.p1  ORF type:complete len:257 (-),score=46.08 TRINITY_DN92955_c0_g1_i1:19-789(-)